MKLTASCASGGTQSYKQLIEELFALNRKKQRTLSGYLNATV